MADPHRIGFWSTARCVAQRELAAAFDSALAYVTLIASLLAINSATLNQFFLVGRLELDGLFEILPLALLMLAPALAMRLWSEDLRTRTCELWLTLPIDSRAVLLGKLGALYLLYGLVLVGTLPMLGLLLYLGEPDLARIAWGYAGALGLGAALLAVCSLFSALSSDSITAFIAGAFSCFVFLASGDPRVIAVLDGLIPSWALGSWLGEYFSLLPIYQACVDGRAAWAEVLRLCGVVLVFGLATHAALQRNRP